VVTMDAFGVSAEQPRRDKRLTLELLEEVARATEGGQPTTTSEMETREGWTPEQVWRELRLLWDEGLIRATSIKDLSDPEGRTNLRISGLTAEGWARYNEPRPGPIRSWFSKHWLAVVTGIVVPILLALLTLAVG
jgi:hypothetical protein